ncbi:GNAT family N-acetyltransferase [Chitinimonas lacunae]|uniref:GNAT family N-acetyltransferase n=1 Tax=Chitinimonas lacunae TaxID=1963018 RepID=A0ABV8MW96_9NEIS
MTTPERLAQPSMVGPQKPFKRAATRFALRAATAADLPALYQICLATALAGHDGSGHYRDPELPGHLYAAPYLVLAPESCLVLEDEAGVCGYALGCADSAAFHARLEQQWLPPLRQRYPLSEASADADGQLIHRLHQPPQWLPALLPFPAHLHLDLLPRAQGCGQGRRLLEALLETLARQGAAGVHWGVDPANGRAVGFYRRLGFEVVWQQPGCLWFATRFSAGEGL